MTDGGTVSPIVRVVALATLTWLMSSTVAHAQLGSLLSPGRLAKAHANLEGLSNCRQCHEWGGRKVAVGKCLACHKPIEERMVKHSGVHKDVKDDCVACHREHAGVDSDLRGFDPATFDHALWTGFALEGRHATLEAGCAACHKDRSLLALRNDCVSCHEDQHKGSLGKSCQTCHSTKTSFKDLDTEFDHTKAAFHLTGAHRSVSCEKCHVNRTWKGVAFSNCTSCHKDPHDQAFGATCATCHTDTKWRTRQVEHSKTTFALVGKHQTVDCAECHKQPAMRVKTKADACAACHVDIHRGEFKQDCKGCHNESGFAKAAFDHSQTKFTLTAKHDPLACEACHKAIVGQSKLPAAKRVADFRGLLVGCVSCHADVHRAQLGDVCDTCHTPESFKVRTFTHKTATDFFGGQHTGLTCEKCHVPQGPVQPVRTGLPLVLNVQYRNLPTSCANCHEDVHLGQEGTQCDTCHTIDRQKFALRDFGHTTTAFPLTGKHETTDCALCHKREAGLFPNGHGVAVRYKGLGRDCRACHEDVHLGQVDAKCETCHSVRAFKIDKYRHRNVRARASFFSGQHNTAMCQGCHKQTTGQFPGGRGTAIRFKVETTCMTCHTDVHKGALGSDCANCHRP